MGRDYIPERDHRAALFMKFFAQGLVAHPERYRITPDEAAAIQQAVTDFRIANARAWGGATRTVSSVRRKNDARRAAERVIRPMAQRIRIDQNIKPSDKVNIGLNVPTKRRRHVAPPASVPVVLPERQDSGAIVVKVIDSLSRRRGKPAGAVGFELYEYVTPVATQPSGAAAAASETISAPAIPAHATNADVLGWRFVGTYSKTPITIRPAVVNRGDQVSLIARWINRRGEVGRFGEPRTVAVADLIQALGTFARPDRRAA